VQDDPLGAGNFEVELDGVSVGLSAVHGLAYDVREGQVGPVTLRRGVGIDEALWAWAREPEPRTVTITLLDVARRPAWRFVLAGARPVTWVGPDLDALSSDIATEELILVADGLDVRPAGRRD
jgi:phage tail-like protein